MVTAMRCGEPATPLRALEISTTTYCDRPFDPVRTLEEIAWVQDDKMDKPLPTLKQQIAKSHVTLSPVYSMRSNGRCDGDASEQQNNLGYDTGGPRVRAAGVN